MLKENHPLASQLLTTHNIAYMIRLMRSMRDAIMQGPDAFDAYVRTFLDQQFPKKKGKVSTDVFMIRAPSKNKLQPLL